MVSLQLQRRYFHQLRKRCCWSVLVGVVLVALVEGVVLVVALASFPLALAKEVSAFSTASSLALEVVEGEEELSCEVAVFPAAFEELSVEVAAFSPLGS
ncbi:MAG: hypothetical protein KatS3mg099_132 [Candidatus Parcubacteria bacterium]|nr:MAG: hypothetical protein KatS3mg099_132 [Candidatus Parcubacteria bacterium]